MNSISGPPIPYTDVYEGPHLPVFSSQLPSFSLKVHANIESVSAPSITTPLTLFPRLAHAFKGCWYALKNWDSESFTEYALQILSTPFAFCATIGKFFFFADLLFQVGKLISFGPFAVVFALVFMAIEGVMEFTRLCQSLFFRYTHRISLLAKHITHLRFDPSKPSSELHQYIEKNQKLFSKYVDASLLTRALIAEGKELQDLSLELRCSLLIPVLEKMDTTYFQVSKEEKSRIHKVTTQMHGKDHPEKLAKEYRTLYHSIRCRKLSTLAKRIRGSATETLLNEIPSALWTLKSNDKKGKEAAIRRLERVFTKLDTVSRKTIHVHLLGLFAILLSIAGMAVTFFVCPLAVPLSLSFVAIVLKYIRSRAPEGYIDTDNYRVNWIALIPSCLRKKSLRTPHWEEKKLNTLCEREMTSVVASPQEPEEDLPSPPSRVHPTITFSPHISPIMPMPLPIPVDPLPLIIIDRKKDTELGTLAMNDHPLL